MENADYYITITVEILLFKQKDNNGNKLIMYLNKEYKLKKKINPAMAGNRTRINCLEGNYADHYTTIAVEMLLFKQKDTGRKKQTIRRKNTSFKTKKTNHCDGRELNPD